MEKQMGFLVSPTGFQLILPLSQQARSAKSPWTRNWCMPTGTLQALGLPRNSASRRGHKFWICKQRGSTAPYTTGLYCSLTRVLHLRNHCNSSALTRQSRLSPPALHEMVRARTYVLYLVKPEKLLGITFRRIGKVIRASSNIYFGGHFKFLSNIFLFIYIFQRRAVCHTKRH